MAQVDRAGSHSKWFVTIVGLVGLVVTIMGLNSLAKSAFQSLGLGWVTSSNGIVELLGYHYINIRESLTYWWLPLVLRWLDVGIEPWMKDVPTVLGAIGLGLPLVRRFIRVTSPALTQVLSKLPAALHPIALCAILVATAIALVAIPISGMYLGMLAYTHGLVFVSSVLRATIPDWIISSVHSALSSMGTVYGAPVLLFVLAIVPLIVIGVLAYLILSQAQSRIGAMLVERFKLRWIRKFLLEVGVLTSQSAFLSAALLGVLVTVDWVGVQLRFWGAPSL